ncbi:DVU0524 family FlgM-associated protein [Desulfocurvus vexinensis]|uniref:DVU0524 family FlgM-associated protein n=1 Tax=Desulfocurvus vexinensis TaxID=399548 RepID=UPI001FE0A8DC|nr:DVU0524 family FlgM-associated protein [Desulfocurvus vexinensis]
METQRMLRTYARQLTSARRLARFRRSLPGADDEATVSRQVKRRLLVEQVSREIVENLVVTGSENQTVQSILTALDSEFGEQLQFQYPPAAIDLQVFRMTDQGPVEVTGPEKQTVFKRLWEITLEKVDDTML